VSPSAQAIRATVASRGTMPTAVQTASMRDSRTPPRGASRATENVAMGRTARPTSTRSRHEMGSRSSRPSATNERDSSGTPPSRSIVDPEGTSTDVTINVHASSSGSASVRSHVRTDPRSGAPTLLNVRAMWRSLTRNLSSVGSCLGPLRRAPRRQSMDRSRQRPGRRVAGRLDRYAEQHAHLARTEMTPGTPATSRSAVPAGLLDNG
jgi:hypothetical protein